MKINKLIKLSVLLRYIRLNKYLKTKDKERKLLLKRKLKETEASFDFNAMYNVDKVKALYKELAVLCHPDKFVNTSNHEIAEELFQRVTVNKSNFTILSELKEEIETKLH